MFNQTVQEHNEKWYPTATQFDEQRNQYISKEEQLPYVSSSSLLQNPVSEHHIKILQKAGVYLPDSIVKVEQTYHNIDNPNYPLQYRILDQQHFEVQGEAGVTDNAFNRSRVADSGVQQLLRSSQGPKQSMMLESEMWNY